MARFTHPANNGTGVSAVVPFIGAFQSAIQQSLGSTSEIKAWELEVTDFSQGVTIENNLSGDPTRITFENPGLYDIQFSTQLHNTGGGGSGAACDIWLGKGGNPVLSSNTRVSVNANSPYVVAAWNFFVEAEAGEYYEILWKTNHTNIVLETLPINGSVPATPSIILTVSQVA